MRVTPLLLLFLIPLGALVWRAFQLYEEGQLWDRLWPFLIYLPLFIYAVHLSRNKNK